MADLAWRAVLRRSMAAAWPLLPPGVAVTSQQQLAGAAWAALQLGEAVKAALHLEGEVEPCCTWQGRSRPCCTWQRRHASSASC